MSSTVEGTVARRKDHKGGKAMSLGIIGAAIALVLVLAVWQMVSTMFHGVKNEYDRDVVAVTSVTEGDKLQPVSAKIMASDNVAMVSQEKVIDASAYADVWMKLERLVPATASDKERLASIETFLAGLDYKMVERGGAIVSITDGASISPSTLTCYLNGYIPDKPYLKTNCPSY